MSTVSASEVSAILNGKGTTFAGIEYNSVVPCAAKYKTVTIVKKTVANVLLFQTVKDHQVYLKAVLRSAALLPENQGKTLDTFEVSETWFYHDTQCHSVVYHKTSNESYLYFVYNSAKSKYFVDGIEVEKEEIKQYLTPSKVKELFDNNSIVHNVKNDISHTVMPRTLKLSNILSLTANKETLAV